MSLLYIRDNLPSQPISLTDINKTKRNKNKEQHKNLNNHRRKTTDICTNWRRWNENETGLEAVYNIQPGNRMCLFYSYWGLL